ncbi:MAG: hypothetical protein KAQ63_03450 [Candidatus Moranbacteria bacterium]|nr:hypothetical protein [Candidatus Moranbacteria bacterium]
MGEEKILGGEENLDKESVGEKGEVAKENSPETAEPGFEQGENKAQDKIKQAEDQIASSASTTQKEDEKIKHHVKDVAGLDKVEDQIQKLTEIATQDSPKTALKVARALNSNYVLDEMHDRLINEEELREVLIKKGFIEKI